MFRKFENPKMESAFYLADGSDLIGVIKSTGSNLKFIWNRGSEQRDIIVDNMNIVLKQRQLLCCTYLQHVEITSESEDLLVLSFNQSFYCIHTHDEEVSCNGLLFFGSDYTPVITVEVEEEERLGILIKVLQDEFDTVDRNQEEMLRILLKRFIIRCTRLARKQLSKTNLSDQQIDIVRRYNILVEKHFRRKRQVADYAKMLYRSPKTITNVFSQQSDTSPLRVIHDRLILEAKRLLLYTDKPTKEIAIELGFDDPSQFSRFFKKQTLETAQEFRGRNQT